MASPSPRTAPLFEQLQAAALQIAFYVPKGGAGKTPQAKNWALVSGAGIITNEPPSLIDIGLPEGRVLKCWPGSPMPDVPAGMKVVYDLGGYPDPAMVPVLQRADAVVVPVFNQLQAKQYAIHALPELRRLARHVVVLVTKVRSPADGAAVTRALRQAGAIDDSVPVFTSRASTAFDWVMEGGRSIDQLCADLPGLRGRFRPVAEELAALYQHFLTLQR